MTPGDVNAVIAELEKRDADLAAARSDVERLFKCLVRLHAVHGFMEDQVDAIWNEDVNALCTALGVDGV